MIQQLLKEIELLRQQLYQLLDEEQTNMQDEQVLILSRDLDKLIKKYLSLL